jgi:hypothetical protein
MGKQLRVALVYTLIGAFLLIAIFLNPTKPVTTIGGSWIECNTPKNCNAISFVNTAVEVFVIIGFILFWGRAIFDKEKEVLNAKQKLDLKFMALLIILLAIPPYALLFWKPNLSIFESMILVIAYIVLLLLVLVPYRILSKKYDVQS